MKAALLVILAMGARALADGVVSLASLESFNCSARQCDLRCSTTDAAASASAGLRLVFHAPDVVQHWLSIDGNWSDVGAAADVIVGPRAPVAVGAPNETAAAVSVTLNGSLTVSVAKAGCLLSVWSHAADGGAGDTAAALVLREVRPRCDASSGLRAGERGGKPRHAASPRAQLAQGTPRRGNAQGQLAPQLALDDDASQPLKQSQGSAPDPIARIASPTAGVTAAVVRLP